MSYLDMPRLHFAGNFKAAPSTVNNRPNNYDLGHIISKGDEAWNPSGNHTFAITEWVRTSSVTMRRCIL
jgi:hypothetical protein